MLCELFTLRLLFCLAGVYLISKEADFLPPPTNPGATMRKELEDSIIRIMLTIIIVISSAVLLAVSTLAAMEGFTYLTQRVW